MKHMKRANIYKASNVAFDPTTLEAFSYDWWQFVAVIGGKVVFNNYSYSPSTVKHQYKVEALLQKLGIRIDMFIEAPKGLQTNLLNDRITEHYNWKIQELQELIAKPRTHKAKNEERKAEIEWLKTKLKDFLALTQKDATKLNKKLYPTYEEHDGKLLSPELTA